MLFVRMSSSSIAQRVPTLGRARCFARSSLMAAALFGCSGNNDTSTGPQSVGAGGTGSTSGGGSSVSTRTGGGSTIGQTTQNTLATGGTRPLTTGTGGAAASGGANGTGGTRTNVSSSTGSTGGNPNTGGTKSVGSSTGGNRATGGVSSAGGSKATGGGSSAGGAKSSGGSKATGGLASLGGSKSTGGSMAGSGGSDAAGGASSTGDCSFTVISNSLSSKMATVGVVEWSTTLASLSSAKIVYTLNTTSTSVLNKGGTAPVDLKKTNYRTLLLGLKPSSDYKFHIEATASNGTSCVSEDYTLPKTGTLSGAPTINRTSTNASAQANGFIVTSGGMNGTGAFIIDADGAVVWYSAAPTQCSRARMDYEGVNMWMLSLNVGNSNGEMRFVSMDGQTSKNNVSGLSAAHHDFTVLPGKVAAMVWAASGSDPESNLVEIASDGSGSATTVFKIGANLYVGGSSAFGGGTGKFHSNAILYHPADDSFTIGDRNPNLYVKVSHAGAVQWQFGGSCTNAPAGASKCVSQTWQVNHGHHLLDNGHFLVFNNGNSGASHVLEFALNTTGTMSATSVKDFSSGNTSSMVLGDVQRLPNGNTLITYSSTGQIIEVDSSWATVQTLKANFGYADWRETLYGAPPR